MKIVVISDTHIPDRAAGLPAKLIEEIRSADMVIHAGDFVAVDFLQKLRSISKELKAVCGNMDPLEIKNILPQKEIFKAGNFRIGVFHGYGAPNRIFDILNSEFKGEKLDIIVFGHTHSSLNEKRENTVFFNPGSPTDKLCEDCNTYGVIELNDRIQAKILKI